MQQKLSLYFCIFVFGSNCKLPKKFNHRNAIPVLKISDSVLILLTDDDINLSFDIFRLCFKILVSLWNIKNVWVCFLIRIITQKCLFVLFFVKPPSSYLVPWVTTQSSPYPVLGPYPWHYQAAWELETQYLHRQKTKVCGPIQNLFY